jgi:transcriptional regulator with XRE-family HTH domain
MASGDPHRMDAAELVRAVRYARRLSQRELAALAEVPPSTVDRIESRQVRDPGFGTVQGLLRPAAYQFVVVDQHGRPLVLNDGRLRAYDRGGRHFPAHLPWNQVTSPLRIWDPDWWGWGKIAWSLDDPVVPKYTFRRRYEVYPDPYGDYRWNDAT